jgi:hypothetical protein
MNVRARARTLRRVKQDCGLEQDFLWKNCCAVSFRVYHRDSDFGAIRFAQPPDSHRKPNRIGIDAMPKPELSEGFSGLQEWSEPLIYDRLLAVYQELLRDLDLARGLTRMHARVWRALIGGDMSDFEALRETLIAALEPCGLTLDHLAEVDSDIMIELLDVVISRYNRSQRIARAYHLALIELAGRLGPTRVSARAA